MTEDFIQRVRNQIIYIAKNGCYDIQCKHCALRLECKDRIPNHSMKLALETIKKYNSDGDEK